MLKSLLRFLYHLYFFKNEMVLLLSLSGKEVCTPQLQKEVVSLDLRKKLCQGDYLFQFLDKNDRSVEVRYLLIVEKDR